MKVKFYTILICYAAQISASNPSSLYANSKMRLLPTMRIFHYVLLFCGVLLCCTMPGATTRQVDTIARKSDTGDIKTDKNTERDRDIYNSICSHIDKTQGQTDKRSWIQTDLDRHLEWINISVRLGSQIFPDGSTLQMDMKTKTNLAKMLDMCDLINGFIHAATKRELPQLAYQWTVMALAAKSAFYDFLSGTGLKFDAQQSCVAELCEILVNNHESEEIERYQKQIKASRHSNLCTFLAEDFLKIQSVDSKHAETLTTDEALDHAKRMMSFYQQAREDADKTQYT